MSQENVRLFFTKVKEINELQEQLKSLQQTAGGDLLSQAVNLGAEHGYEFTEEEMRDELQQISISTVEEGELSDEQLEAVAGGGCPYCMTTKGSYCMCTGKFTESWF